MHPFLYTLFVRRERHFPISRTFSSRAPCVGGHKLCNYGHMSNHLLVRDTLAPKAFEEACAEQAESIRRLSGGLRISIGPGEALDIARELSRSFAESEHA